MDSKPKDQKQDRPQEEPQLHYTFTVGGSLGHGAIGEAPLGGSIQVKETTSGVRTAEAGAYEVGLYFRSPLDFERSKYGDLKRTRQLLLDENLVSLLDADKKTAEYQPDWGITELRVLDAIQRMIDKRYKPGEEIAVDFSPQEFYDLCGLKKNSKGKRSRKLETEYLETLQHLASSPAKIIQQESYYESDKKGRKGGLKYRTYRVRGSIFKLTQADMIESDTREDARAVLEMALSDQELPQRKRTTRYRLMPDPIMYRLLDSLYVRKSITQYEEIQALHPGEKLKPSTQAFLNYIQSLDISPLPVSRATLAERMNLHTYIQQRKRTLINSRINEALEDALQTRYILKYHEEPTGLLIIYLNPEKCSRLQAKLDRAKKEEV